MPENNATTESGNFSAEERAAMKKRAAELRVEKKVAELVKAAIS